MVITKREGFFFVPDQKNNYDGQIIAIEKLEGSLPRNACTFSGSSGSQTGFPLYLWLPLPVMDLVLKMSDPQMATAKFLTNNEFFC